MRNTGFTLIELLLVIAIILSIAALMSPALWSIRQKALVVGCQSNLRQINIYLIIYAGDHNDNIPRTCQDVEARNHPRKMRDPYTKIPNLKGLFAGMSRSDRGMLKVLRCPADSGSFGQDVYPTPQGMTSWQYFGQSQHVNIEMYTGYLDDKWVPSYNPEGDGSMYGANPVKRKISKRDPSKFLVLSDMWSHWHNDIAINGENNDHTLNILYFDNHIANKGFESSLAAKRFLNRDDTKRWWPLPDE